MSRQPILIIPARMRSARLPGKPLADIAGLPMIAHVVARALEAGFGPVLVATDDAAIARAASAAGAEAVMTGEHATGSDRIAEAVASVDPHRRHDVVVNLQGDEPEADPAALRAVLDPLDDPAVAIATLAAPLLDADRANTNAVKLLGEPLGATRVRAVRFSRALPLGTPPGAAWRHVGIYAYRRAALERFVALPRSRNELRERLEQLRAVDNGMRIDAALVAKAHRGIDTPADLAEVRERFAKGKD